MNCLICMDCTPNKVFEIKSSEDVRDAINHKRIHLADKTFKYGLRKSIKVDSQI